MTPGAGVLALCVSAASAAPAAHGAALQRLAAEVSAEVAQASAEPPLGVWAHGDSAELSRAFATLLSAELARRNLAPLALDGATPADAERAAREKGARSAVRVTLALEHGSLSARGDLIGTWVNFWSGASATRPASPAAPLVASVDADAQVLAFAALGPPQQPPAPSALKLAGSTVLRLPLPVAALAMGDVDGDGRAEVVALTDEEVLVVSASGRVLARRDQRALPDASTPCREPFGSVAILRNPARIAYRSARRAKGEVLELDARAGTLRPVGTLDDAPLAAHREESWSSTFVPGESLFDGEATSGGGKGVGLGGPFVTFSAASTASPFYAVVFPDGSGAVAADPGQLASAPRLTELGAGTVLADVDGDGRAELVTTSPRYQPSPEELRVIRLDGAEPQEALRVPLDPARGGRILSLAAGDVDGDGAEEVAAAVGWPDGTGEIQLWRRAP